MDVQTITTLISSVGFPIFACVAMGMYIKLQNDKYDKQITELMSAHKAESDKFAEALDKNTIVLEKIYERLNNK